MFAQGVGSGLRAGLSGGGAGGNAGFSGGGAGLLGGGGAGRLGGGGSLPRLEQVTWNMRVELSLGTCVSNCRSQESISR